jgi:hypothetical protein
MEVGQGCSAKGIYGALSSTVNVTKSLLFNAQCKQKPESKPHYNRVSKVYTPNFSLKIAAALATLADPDCATVRSKAVFISHYVTTPRHEHAGSRLYKLLATILQQAKNRELRRRRKKRTLRNEKNERRK